MAKGLEEQLLEMLNRQKAAWALCGKNFADLTKVLHKDFSINGQNVRVQCNPARVRSSCANTTASAIAERKCFLCADNRPAEQETVRWRGYDCLVNPYPIFNHHFTIASVKHEPQNLDSVLDDLTDLAAQLPHHFVFYNGPRCGASAPDHLHLQVGVPEQIPMFGWTDNIQQDQPVSIWGEEGLPAVAIVNANTPHLAAQRTRLVMRELTKGDDEPMVNIIARLHNNTVNVYIIPRRAFRPEQYYAQDDSQLLISPATAEMAGLLITPITEHLNKITADDIRSIYSQCSFTQAELHKMITPVPIIHVGVASSDNVRSYRGEDGLAHLDNVIIGKDFHWQQARSFRYEGTVRKVSIDGEKHFINDIDAESYLRSVISSEMSPNSPSELLKAHAIISRTWLLRGIVERGCITQSQTPPAGDIRIRIYERDAHKGFDVCADDHCQRYQGVHNSTNQAVSDAVSQTSGMVLTYRGEVCDARFSKCCGGHTELFSTCWADIDFPYLTSHEDPYCNPYKYPLNTFSLNDYDRPTSDYYAWQVTITGSEIRQIVKQKTGIDLGDIIDLEPMRRGPSGRICLMKFKGTHSSLTVGKELEIRRLLSPTHLYSSAFEIETTNTAGGDGAAQTANADSSETAVFRLKGRGWGHGVGLCQIGAANMAAEGKTFREILDFYYPGTEIVTLY